jgi:hypothetical protein
MGKEKKIDGKNMSRKKKDRSGNWIGNLKRSSLEGLPVVGIDVISHILCLSFSIHGIV